MPEYAALTHRRVGSIDPETGARHMRRCLLWRRLLSAVDGRDHSPLNLDPSTLATRYPEHSEVIERCLRGEPHARRELDRLAGGLATRSLAALQAREREQRAQKPTTNDRMRQQQRLNQLRIDLARTTQGL
jgi:hypothetical protein